MAKDVFSAESKTLDGSNCDNAESYKKILLAVDLTEESNDVASRAIFLAEQTKQRFTSST